MRIDKLDLRAFGPFSDAVLDLSQGSHGLHLIYGPNEAGKSSALRAIHDLLYGVPVRSPDNFIHPYPKMRIAATVRHSDGSELKFVRRKGSNNTLRDENDRTPLDDEQLARMLGGVDADLFTTMFGIDHQRLIRGGEEIVGGRGRIGEILFAAGSGVAGLRKVQDELQTEMDSLFKSGGRKQKINEAVQLLQKARTDLKSLQLSSDEWLRHRQALDDAERLRQDLDERLHQSRREESRLARIRDAMSAIARWKQLQTELEPYADAPILPEDFGQKRSDLLARLRGAERQRAEFQEAVERLQRELDSLDVAEGVLEEAEAIEALRERLGSYRKAMADRPGLANARDMADRDAQEILKKLGQPIELDDAERLRLPVDKTTRIHELANQQQAMVARVETARKTREQKRRSIAEIESKMATLEAATDASQLRQVVRRIQQQGDLEGQLRDADDELEQLAADADVRLARLGLWSGSLDALERLGVPSDETVDRFEQEFRDVEGRIEKLGDRHRAEQETVDQLQAEIRRLDLAQAVPTEEELARARSVRQEGWRLVQRAWQEGIEEDPDVEAFLAQLDASTGLADAFQQAVDKADELADRLRREADRVASRAKLQADCDRAAQLCRTIEAEQHTVEDEAAAIHRKWAELWAPLAIEPLSPREMRSWLVRQQKLTDTAAEMRELQARRKRLASQLDSDRQSLTDCLAAFGIPASDSPEPLATLIEQAEAFLDQVEACRRERDLLEHALDERQDELKNTDGECSESAKRLADWQTKWADAIGHLGLDQDATAAQANTVLTHLNELFTKLHDADQYGLRLEGIDDDSRQLTADVQSMVDRVAPDLKKLDVDEAIIRLGRLLTEARERRQKQTSLSQQHKQSKAGLDEACQAISAAEAELKTICEQAGCQSHEELAEAQRRSDCRRELQIAIDAAKEQILSHSGGAPLDEFLREAEAVDPDSLTSQIDGLGKTITELEDQRTDVNQAIGRQQQELDQMDGNDAAAEKAELCEQMVAQLDEDIRHYAVLRLASAVLREGIERYRAKHQGPILDAAGRLFAQLTAGSFEGLQTDLDSAGQPVLLGVRPGAKETVGVEAMSDGACDQLYLALRIASIENWLDDHEPIPLIVDDVLLNFDDHRGEQALKTLGELSCRTQVIFFTHHQHLVDLARASLPEDTLFRHHLEGACVVP